MSRQFLPGPSSRQNILTLTEKQTNAYRWSLGYSFDDEDTPCRGTLIPSPGTWRKNYPSAPCFLRIYWLTNCLFNSKEYHRLRVFSNKILTRRQANHSHFSTVGWLSVVYWSSLGKLPSLSVATLSGSQSGGQPVNLSAFHPARKSASLSVCHSVSCIQWQLSRINLNSFCNRAESHVV